MISGIEKYFNKEIKSANVSGDTLTISFTDGSKIEFEDQGQSCCEKRYMNTDDCLSEFKGAKFVNATIQDGPSKPPKEKYGEEADSQFLIVTTTKGQFTVVNYNEHNGYYGGFDVVLKETK